MTMSDLPATDPTASSFAHPSSAPRTALVTGGSRGIGRAVCLAFGSAGWQVGVHYRERKDEAAETADTIRRGGAEAIISQADIRHADQVKTMIDDVIARWGCLDVLICNAGIASSRLLLRLQPGEWHDVLQTNLTGTFHCLQAAGPHMLSRGDGSVVVVSSYAAAQGRTGQGAYAAAKAALIGLVKSTAREWGRQNVRINAVFPGRHQTAMSVNGMSNDERGEPVLQRTPNLAAVASTIYHLALLPDVSGQVWNLDSRII